MIGVRLKSGAHNPDGQNPDEKVRMNKIRTIPKYGRWQNTDGKNTDSTKIRISVYSPSGFRPSRFCPSRRQKSQLIWLIHGVRTASIVIYDSYNMNQCYYVKKTELGSRTSYSKAWKGAGKMSAINYLVQGLLRGTLELFRCALFSALRIHALQGFAIA